MSEHTTKITDDELHDEYNYASQSVRNTKMTIENLERCGWTYKWGVGPSAEGPSLSKGKFWCQQLAPGSVDAHNRGINPSCNLHIWTTHQDQIETLFIGRCPNLEVFQFICKLLMIPDGKEMD